MRREAVDLAAIAMLATLLTAESASAEVMRGSVVGYGATPSNGSTGSGYVMRGTVGQPAVGVSADRTRILNHGFWCFGGSRVIAVDEPGTGVALPPAFALGRPAPHPVRDAATFLLSLPHAARVALRIYDVQGRRVEQIVEQTLDAGYHVVPWRPSTGPGVYFARLEIDGFPRGERRVIVLR